MNTKKVSGIREMGSLVLATALYWIVSKNCSDLSREKKNCSVLGSGRLPNRLIPEAPELHVKLAKMPRGCDTGCIFFLKKRHAFCCWAQISGTFSGYDFVCVRHGLAGLRQNCSGSLVSFFIRL